MISGKKRLLTGLQPSGDLHIGNYFGVLKPFLELYESYDSYLMVADYHALTTLKDPNTLRQHSINVVKDYIALGIDPKNVTLFKQSDVPEHTELAWVFECLVTVPFLMQAHAYKDKTAKGLEANAGLFNYPVLMAADILLYDIEVVPVGEDQRQHVEYAREVGTKFNNTFGETFTAPEEKVLKAVGVVPGTDGRKMSKSYNNTIPLFGTKDEVTKAVMGIVTDSEGKRPEHVYAIHELLKDSKELDALYAKEEGSYKNLKEALIADLEAVIDPMRSVRDSITDDDVKDILKEGAEKAREHAHAKMQKVRDVIGVAL